MQLTPKTKCARDLARQFPEDWPHLDHVARLGELLFDALQPLHGLGARERELLACAALLHDIGLSASPIGHHRASLRLILASELPALGEGEKLIVANIARYHRKALPSARHPHFARLSASEQETVRRLAALLRIADGLDRLHENAVECVEARPGQRGCWTLVIGGPGDLGHAAWGATRKADLFREAFGAALEIEVEKESRRGRGVEGAAP